MSHDLQRTHTTSKCPFINLMSTSGGTLAGVASHHVLAPLFKILVMMSMTLEKRISNSDLGHDAVRKLGYGYITGQLCVRTRRGMHG